MVRVGYPSSELAFNHAIECLEMFGIGFTSDQVKVAGKRAAEALADAAYYLCSLVPTIGRRIESILPVLAELGFFFLPATGAVAMAILSDPGAYNDKLDNGTYTLRVGEDAAAAPKEYYLFRYFTQQHTKRTFCGGRLSHKKDSQERIFGISPATLAEGLYEFILRQPWATVKEGRSPARKVRFVTLVTRLHDALTKYDVYLEEQSQRTAVRHDLTMEELAREAILNRRVLILPLKGPLNPHFCRLAEALDKAQLFAPLLLTDFLPAATDTNSRRHLRRAIRMLEERGLTIRAALCKLGGAHGDARVQEYV